MPPRTRIDVSSLYAALDAARLSRNISWRQVAQEIGISPSTFSRLATELKPDVDAFVAMVWWLRMPAERFIVGPDGSDRGEEPELLAELAVLLRGRRDISADEVDYLENLLGVVLRRVPASRRPGSGA